MSADYTVYSVEGAPKGWGVEAIVQPDIRVGYAIISSGDYYICRDGRWMGVDLAGMLDYVVNELGVVMVGRTISHEEFTRILNLAKDERDEKKTGWLRQERRP